MRKIEREMVQAIIERRNWRKANTEVRVLEQTGGQGRPGAAAWKPYRAV